MNIDARDIEMIHTAALLHDIGLIGLPRDILDKGEIELKHEAANLIKQHPVIGQDIIGFADDLKDIGILVRSHHETYDGSGYPNGLKREDIPLGSRIIAVCDMYDTLVHSKNPNDIHAASKEASDYIIIKRGTIFDPEIANDFLDFIEAVQKNESQKMVAAIPLSDIKEGMMLARDLKTGGGKILIGKGTKITSALLQRIMDFHKIDPIVDRVYVER